MEEVAGQLAAFVQQHAPLPAVTAADLDAWPSCPSRAWATSSTC